MVQFDPSLLAKVAEKALEKFKKLDKDGDGFISRTEFQNSIIDTYQNNGQQIKGTHAQGTTIGDILANQDERFKKYDTTKGVKDKGLDFDEFSAMYREEIYDEVAPSSSEPKESATSQSVPNAESTPSQSVQQAEPEPIQATNETADKTEVNKDITSFPIVNKK